MSQLLELLCSVVVEILGAVANRRRRHLSRRHLARCVEVHAPLETRAVYTLPERVNAPGLMNLASA